MVTETIRKSIWQQHFLAVLKHNDEAAIGLHNYTLRVNHLADMDLKEYVKEMVKLLQSLQKMNEENILGFPHHDPATIPDEIRVFLNGFQLDWREKGYLTPVLNQQDCGACYAFAIAAMIEAQEYIKTRILRRLSSQQMVDCSKSMGNMGCRGGSFRNTLQYIQQHGLASNDKYPYKAKESICKYKKSDKAIEIKSWTVIPSKDEFALRTAVAVVGPIAVSINASPSTFQLYHAGIYDDPKCTSDRVNHAMLLIGYTKNAWILKNWWSESWGDGGYMYLRRDNNQCGIANYAAYALL